MNSFQPPTSFLSSDPFQDARSFQTTIIKNKYHIRIQQRNGKKSITTIQGWEEDLDVKRICKAMRAAFSCNGNVIEDKKEGGEIIQLQGDQRENAKQWILDQEIITKSEADRIVIHGF
jgi:translation initiation factor 1